MCSQAVLLVPSQSSNRRVSPARHKASTCFRWNVPKVPLSSCCKKFSSSAANHRVLVERHPWNNTGPGHGKSSRECRSKTSCTAPTKRRSTCSRSWYTCVTHHWKEGNWVFDLFFCPQGFRSNTKLEILAKTWHLRRPHPTPPRCWPRVVGGDALLASLFAHKVRKALCYTKRKTFGKKRLSWKSPISTA